MGLEASQAYTLLMIMTVCGGLILLAVIVLSALAIYGDGRLRALLSHESLIIGGGLIFPVVVLTALLAVGLSVMTGRAASPAGDGAIRVAITGEMWWWRVRYELPDGTSFESANELRLPVGEPVELALMTADVIHSFWAPALAGKLDMIPGRTNTMTITATEQGISRGQCAEYCGGAHAFMAFFVVADTPEEFAEWAEKEAGPRVTPDSNQNENSCCDQLGSATLPSSGLRCMSHHSRDRRLWRDRTRSHACRWPHVSRCRYPRK